MVFNIPNRSFICKHNAPLYLTPVYVDAVSEPAGVRTLHQSDVAGLRVTLVVVLDDGRRRHVRQHLPGERLVQEAIPQPTHEVRHQELVGVPRDDLQQEDAVIAQKVAELPAEVLICRRLQSVATGTASCSDMRTMFNVINCVT